MNLILPPLPPIFENDDVICCHILTKPGKFCVYMGHVCLHSLSPGLGKEVMCVILTIVIGIMTVVGGVGGGIYVAYFSCALLLVIMLYYLTDVYYDPLDRSDNEFGSVNSVYNITRCGKGHEDNNDNSLLTFLSPDGLAEGLVVLLCKST